MNVYKVPYVRKNGGYREPDQVTSGGYYSVVKYEVLTCSTAKRAAELCRILHPSCVVRRPVLVGPA